MAKTINRFAALGAAVLLGALAPRAEAATTNSPVGSWDLVFTGLQRGVAQITFNNGGTLTGFEVITAKPHSSNQDLDGRPPGIQNDRVVSGSSNQPPTLLFGGGGLTGSWGYDTAAHVVGVITESGSELTNGISFQATVKEGVHISMTGFRAGFRTSYRGVPLVALTNDFSGDYYSTGRRNGIDFIELFTLTPGTDPNSYHVVGVGPGYNITGGMYISSMKQFGYYALTDETTNGVLRSVTGGFNLKKGTGDGAGISENPTGGSHVNVRIKVFKQ